MYPLDFLSERADVWKQSTHSFVQSLAISSKVWVIERVGNTKAYTNLLERVQGSNSEILEISYIASDDDQI